MGQLNQRQSWQLHCPIEISPSGNRITLAHGEGGRLTRNLIRDRIVKTLGHESFISMDDAARLAAIDGELAITTDSFVVTPLFFPGGDIGSMSVYGTANDLAVNGARPLYLTSSLIIEEGFPIELLDCVLNQMADAAKRVPIQIVAGDTKVVPRGAVDGLFLNTTGVGQLVEPAPPGPTSLQEGDELLVTGPIGRHGIAVLCAREELGLEPPPQSDCAPLIGACEILRNRLGGRIRAMRDATRGGVGAVLHEWAEAAGLTLTVNEHDIPVSPDVRGACELLGLDPLHVANEGTMVVAVESGSAKAAIEALQGLPDFQQTKRIGLVKKKGISPVTIFRTLGPEQPLDDPLGAPLPRIC